jgi:hypothetical protein
MELLKKPVRSYRTIDIRETEEMLEHSIIVPDSKADVLKILLADAECFVSSVEKSGRMIEVNGEIRYRILYCSDTPEQKPDSIIARYPWSASLQKPKNDGDIGVFVSCRCQHIEAAAANGRKIVARSVISLMCRFYEIRNDEMGREILGENVFLKTSPVNVVALKDNGNINAKVTNLVSLPNGSPAIKEVLFSRVNMGCAEISYREEEPCLEAKGSLYLLYRSDTMDESIESVVLEFPVKTAVGVQASPDTIVFASSNLRGWDIEVVEDNDGMNTQVSVNMEVEIDAQAMAHEEEILIDDAYSVEFQMSLNKTPMNLITDEKEFCEVYEMTQRIHLDTEGNHLDEILMVCANERNIASKIMDRNISVQGTVGVDAVFCTEGKQIHSQSIELPFTQGFVLPDNGQWQIVQSCLHIEDVRYDISGSEAIIVMIKLKIRVRAARIEEITCTSGLSASKDENGRKAPIILYYTQPNDTLWDIAKHYRIPVAQLAADNGLDAETRPEVGRRLFIM